MANYAYGIVTVYGKFADVKNFILNGIVNVHTELINGKTVEEQPKINENGLVTGENGHDCYEWLWMKDTNRHFPTFGVKPFNVNACNDDEDYSYDFDIEAAWSVNVDDLAKISAKYHIGFRSDYIEEPGCMFTQEFDVKDGAIIVDETGEYEPEDDEEE